VGLSALIAAAALGANPLIAVDVVEDKLALARSLGATHAVNATTMDPLAVCRELTGGKGADFAVEATGNPSAMEAAFEAVRVGGGLCVIAGNAAHDARIQLNPFSLINGKRIVGSWGGEARMDEDVPRYAAMFGDGRLPLSKLITAEYPLAEINRAFSDLEGGRVARALVRLG
ncbi:MAG: zinc-binding dehydrogenase, partial [Alphaproteobacteria bacterium]